MFIGKTTLVFLVFCAVIYISEGNDRVKRTKYSYPTRFYRKPPPPHVIKGPFSYTPPPGYMRDDEGPPPRHPPPKVSRKPNDGLGDEDINNLVKYLSKNDLDKIVEFASEKERFSERYRDEKYGFDKPSHKRPQRFTDLSNDDEKFLLNGPYKTQESKYQTEYNNGPRPPTPMTYPDGYLVKTPDINYINDATQPEIVYSKPPEQYNQYELTNNQQEMSKAQFVYNQQEKDISINIPFANPIFRNPVLMPNDAASQMPNLIYTNPPQFQSYPHHTQSNLEESNRQFISYVTVPPLDVNGDIYTNSDNMKEEQLPKPLNLRDDHYEASNTDAVPKIVSPESYQVESFKELPLMNEYHNTKLHSMSSYTVPHYTVTQTQSQPSSNKPSQSKIPAIEKAPPGYSGKEMSDAHLKAVRIWTHHSRGTAYTLHNDGSLSLEKPKIKTSYGYA